MFGSISNWVNTNVPTSMPTLPTLNMPTLPTVHMPGSLNFLGKNKTTAEPAGDEATAAADVKVEVGEETVSSRPASQNSMNKTEVVEEPAKSTDETKLEEDEVVDTPETAAKSENHSQMGATKALESAKELGSNIGSMLFSFGKNASNNVRKTATQLKDVIEKKTLIGEFSKENEKFVNEKKVQQRREEAAVAPWVGYNEEEKLKEQIISLSADSRNFLKSPPSGVDFHFDFDVAYPIAMAIIEEDPALQDMRFRLVPKQVNEENFWRNYFYRVSLIKQSTQLDELAAKNQVEDSEWDKEISAEELEKEINQMLG